MSSFTIQVLNNSRNNQVYSLFYQPFSASGYAPLACVTQKSTTIANNYAATFTIDLPTAVVCGTSPNQPLGTGVNVSIQESTVITPPEVVRVNIQNNSPYFPPPTQETTAVGNWARIVTQNYNTNPTAHVFCGLGVVSPGSGQIVPSCVWEIQPNTPYAILTPPQQPVFYISSDSSLDVGTITAATSKDATVDFTDTGDNFCLVTQMSNNTFKVAPPSDVKT
ncbi:uncharacterized protein NFIA_106940 [Aspergillus fischeri NRRL 181]|uniref:Uncharacterized protein n=1 Tax=Neosartorya fischeri (strain ATCC 1020 / DSM 3700 / CBS 544.65 / FGSC A1164 / JCM 1740 / NRRL 181 / WB 181) TaxID=331117 RepID=A1CX52_NEOFI|nr:uncharacterized protein NFIA_106940 [Aspergillus fischeri NRRL 181]EAW25204.1 hypothetical protein NFIA_106940 [Aspergillus fischeri NRRL 181]KAG2027014.1 hypothetical protein GB937_000750 [Aspergillus fischeri]